MAKSKMKKETIHILERNVETFEKYLQDDLSELDRGDSLSLYFAVSRRSYIVACNKYRLQENARDFRDFMYLVGKFSDKEFQLYRRHYPDKLLEGQFRSSWTMAQYLMGTVVGGHVALARVVAEEHMGKYGKEDETYLGKAGVHLGKCFKPLLLDRRDEAAAAIEAFNAWKARRKKPGHFARQTSMMEALLARDGPGLVEALAVFLKTYACAAPWYNVGDDHLCIHGLAYLNLARFYGMDVESPDERWCPSPLIWHYGSDGEALMP